jgi:hypothetical protein
VLTKIGAAGGTAKKFAGIADFEPDEQTALPVGRSAVFVPKGAASDQTGSPRSKCPNGFKSRQTPRLSVKLTLT